MFQFFKPKSRVVYFHTGHVSLHNFETGEWVITLMVGNQHIELPASYLLSEDQDLGDPRLPEFTGQIKKIASFYRSGIGWGSDANSHRGIFPRVCDLSNPEFANGECFSNYHVGTEAYEKSKGGSVE